MQESGAGDFAALKIQEKSVRVGLLSQPRCLQLVP